MVALVRLYPVIMFNWTVIPVTLLLNKDASELNLLGNDPNSGELSQL